MHELMYNSNPGSNYASLSEESWKYFSRFLSTYQWALDDPCKSPRKEEIRQAILNRGKKGSNTFWRGDWKVIVRPLHDWVFESAIANQRKLYYVSNGSYALPYLDIDLHNAWQTPAEGQEAKRLINALFFKVFQKETLFWAESSRGFNGYLKVDCQRQEPEYANATFARLQTAIRLLLAHYQNLADFEIKAKLGFMLDGEYQWAQYGKLPIHLPSWSFSKLEEFKATGMVGLDRLEKLCQEIERQIPQEVLEAHKLHKKSLGDMPIVKDGFFLVTPTIEKALLEKHGPGWQYMFSLYRGDNEGVWLGLNYFRPGQLPMTHMEWQAAKIEAEVAAKAEADEAANGHADADVPVVAPASIDTPTPPKPMPSKLNIKVVDLPAEPDSFIRQKEALFRLARSLKRVPTVVEALQFIKDQQLFTGSWQENLGRRKARLHSILKWISNTFDASKCGNGSVNVGKFDEWAKNKFPNGVVGKRTTSMTEDGELIHGDGVHVDAEFISIFMSISEFSLRIHRNLDGTLPHKRAKELWNALVAKELVTIPFCDRKWAACREAMVDHGIVCITNRNYYPGKAMEWEVGTYFPFLGLWKGKKHKAIANGDSKRRRTTRRHNTLLLLQPQKTAEVASLTMPRPPP